VNTRLPVKNAGDTGSNIEDIREISRNTLTLTFLTLLAGPTSLAPVTLKVEKAQQAIRDASHKMSFCDT
jgi:hypothetical protein